MCFFFLQRMFLVVYNISPHCSLELFLVAYPELNKFGSPTYVLIFNTLQNGELLWNGRTELHPREAQCVSEFTTVFRPFLGTIVIRFLPSRHSGTSPLKWQFMTLNIHKFLVPRLRNRGLVSPSRLCGN
jgi:hypothetical protein